MFVGEAASVAGSATLLLRRFGQKDMGPACGVVGGAHCAAAPADTSMLLPPW
jgi:hypothetical protein